MATMLHDGFNAHIAHMRWSHSILRAILRRAFDLAKSLEAGIVFAVRLVLDDRLAWSEFLNHPDRIQRRYESFQNKRKAKSDYRASVQVDGLEIVISCYNHGRFLEKALRCIELQTKTGRIPVTIVENGSTDDTRVILKKMKVPDRIDLNVILLDRNVGMAEGFNRGINEARQDLVTLLCSDDYLVPNFVEGAIEAFNVNKDIAMLGGSSSWFSTDEELEASLLQYSYPQFARTVRRHSPGDYDVSKGPNCISMSLSSLTFFRSVWRNVGKIERKKRKRISEYDDRDFELRVCALYPVGISSETFMYYRTGSSNWTP
jgi:GT2 family glycosyltransferase